MSNNNDPLITYALNAEDQLVSINDIQKIGHKYYFRCPKCKEQIIAKIGHGIRRPHFAHKNESNCQGAHLAILHTMAESIIEEEKSVMAPKYKFIKAQRLFFCTIEKEKRNDRNDLQPDIVGVTDDGKRFMIEIKNTHEVDDNKRDKIQESNYTCLEIDVSNQTPETIRYFLLQSTEHREWINNPIYDEQIITIQRERLLKIEEESLIVFHVPNYNEQKGFDVNVERKETDYVSQDGFFRRVRLYTSHGVYIVNIGFKTTLQSYLQSFKKDDFLISDCDELNLFIEEQADNNIAPIIEWVKKSPKEEKAKRRKCNSPFINEKGDSGLLDDLYDDIEKKGKIRTERFGETIVMKHKKTNNYSIIILHKNGIDDYGSSGGSPYPYHVGKYIFEGNEIKYENIADFVKGDEKKAWSRYDGL